jgi:hypothetical protein
VFYVAVQNDPFRDVWHQDFLSDAKLPRCGFKHLDSSPGLPRREWSCRSSIVAPQWGQRLGPSLDGEGLLQLCVALTALGDD